MSDRKLFDQEDYSQLNAADHFKAMAHNFGNAIEIMYVSRKEKIVSRESKLKALSYILNKRISPAAMLKAPSGAGKTALAKAWKLYQDDLDKIHVQVIALTMMKLANGGDMADRMQRLIPTLKEYEEKLQTEDPKARVALFIDEAHTMVSAFDTTGVATKIGGELLKTILTDCPIMVIGATTDREYNDYIAVDGALARRFDNLQVDVLKKDTVISVLRDWLVTHGGDSYRYLVSDDVLNYIVVNNARFNMELAEPAKSLQILENAFSIHELDNIPLDRNVVDRAFATKNIRPNEIADFDRINAVFAQKIKGQRLALIKMKRAILNMVIPTSRSDRPRMAALLLGPTGVGKTASVKALALALKGDEEAYVPFDMSNYTGADGKERFIRKLGEAVKEDPEAILLFDEIEKALENQVILLQILDEGRISYFKNSRDGSGEVEVTVSLKGTKIFATSNAGAKMFDSVHRYSPNRDGKKTDDELEEMWNDDEIDIGEAIINDGFKPEVYNRFKDIIPYYALTRSDKVEIASSMINQRIDAFSDLYDIEVVLPSAKKWGAYPDIDVADAVSMFVAIEKQEGKGTKDGGARDIEKTIEYYFDGAIKEAMVKNRNVSRFSVRTNGKSNFEQNTAYQRERSIALSNGLSETEFEDTFGRNASNKAGKLEVVPYTYSI